MKKSKDTAKLSDRCVYTDEAQENRMIYKAMILAERQLDEGTASSQVITHFLKLGSSKEKLEQEILSEQKKLLEAKTEALASQKRVEELYADALKAMRGYQGAEEEVDYENY